MLEFLVFREGRQYVGVCLTLNIVEEGSNPVRLMESIVEAARGHVRLVIKKRLSDDLLNRPAPDKYWDRYLGALDEFANRTSKSGSAFTTQLPWVERKKPWI